MNPQQPSISMTRVILAIALTIGTLSLYSYFFPQRTQEVQQITSQNKTPPQTLEGPKNSSPLYQQDEILMVVKARDFEIEIDSLGRIAQVYLKEKKFLAPKQEGLFARLFGKKQDEGIKDKLPLMQGNAVRPLEVRFADTQLNTLAFKNVYIAPSKEVVLEDSPVKVELVQKLGNEEFKKIITFYPNMSFEVQTSLSKADSVYFLTNGARPIADEDPYAFLGTIVQKEGGNLEKFEEDDAEGVEEFKKSVFIAGVDRYFTTLLYTKAPQGFDVLVDGNVASKNPIAFVQMQNTQSLLGYIGPKTYDLLKGLYEPLGDVVEYGLITFFAKPLFFLLEALYGICQNWGWAIVLLTILVRLVLFPLSYKGMIGMQKLKDIAPQMKEIQAQYKNDPQKLQKHMMELYRKNGANPLGGCLPLLLQIPVFFAIYKVLYCAVELKSASWIWWIHDLSAIDPYYVLPIFMGVTMYVSQIMTPSTFTDPMQEKVFKMLPLFFAIFFIIFPFPAGLVLYWSVNNILSIAQQLVINKITAKGKKNEKN